VFKVLNMIVILGRMTPLCSVLAGEVILPPCRAAAPRMVYRDQTDYVRVSSRNAKEQYAGDQEEGPCCVMMIRFEPAPLRG
jgi:hypothetical protein